MLKKLALMVAAAFVFIPAANAQVSLDTPVLDVNLGVPSVGVDMDSEERIITYPVVTTGAAACPHVITQPAVVQPVQHYNVLGCPAVTTGAAACPQVITQPAVVQPMAVQQYNVLEYPAVTTTTSSMTCPAVIEQSAVVAPAPRMYEFLVPAPRTNVRDADRGLGILNPLNWFGAIF
jgi:septum formation inhibitor-activating ATPase MinD